MEKQNEVKQIVKNILHLIIDNSNYAQLKRKNIEDKTSDIEDKTSDIELL